MPRGNGIYQPWSVLKGLLSARPAESSVTKRKHPARRVLRAHIEGILPQRPNEWTKERAEELAKGRLCHWTHLEVAAHVADCERCRARLRDLRGRQSAAHISTLERLRNAVSQPRRARLGWALAGAQAVALIGLVVWTAFFAGPETQTGKPISFPLLNGVSEYQSSLEAPALWVEFSPQAPWSEVTTWLLSLGAEVLGPDAEGRYLVMGEDIGSDLLEASPWVMRVDSVVEGSDEP
jgi:hypothetical protein